MTRRTALSAGAGILAGSAAPAAAQPSKKAVFEMRWIRMRNGSDNQSQRINGFLSKSVIPALQRAGAGPIGVFSPVYGGHTPSVLVVSQYASMAAYETAVEKVLSGGASDKELAKERESAYSTPGLNYVRMEVSLLRGFDSMPAIELPPTEGRKAGRIFELRVYESNNYHTLQRKVKMFDDGEIDIFRKSDMLPVFFGETIAGPNMPNLTYLLGFDDMAHREKAWGVFARSPEWQKLRSQPGLSDAEIVSNISSMILRPAAYSQIR
jgi:hypothetical protein